MTFEGFILIVGFIILVCIFVDNLLFHLTYTEEREKMFRDIQALEMELGIGYYNLPYRSGGRQSRQSYYLRYTPYPRIGVEQPEFIEHHHHLYSY